MLLLLLLTPILEPESLPGATQFCASNGQCNPTVPLRRGCTLAGRALSHMCCKARLCRCRGPGLAQSAVPTLRCWRDYQQSRASIAQSAQGFREGVPGAARWLETGVL